MRTLMERDENLNAKIREHISKFPRAESHYCRSSTSREYLSPELTVSKMYEMFVKENADLCCAYSTYFRIFKSMKLSFLSPKKDMCGLCSTYRETTNETEREKLNSAIKRT